MTQVQIQIITLKKIKQEKNPGIKRALERASNELTKTHPPYIGILFIYIDGDPHHKRWINYN